MQNDISIVDLQYFIQITYLKEVVKSSNVVFDIFEAHQKRSFLNRCEIAGSNGKICLSVPLLEGRNQRTIFKDIRISNAEKWQLKHWRSILSSYNGSPWFSHYKDEMAELYNRPYTYLRDWNLACTTWLFEKLNLQKTVELTNGPLKNDDIVAGIADLRKSSGLMKKLVEPGAVTYRQVFQDKLGFIPGLSAIDLLFCEGPGRTVELLK